jgi:hypothetical protein
MTLGFKLSPLARIGGFKFIMPMNAFMTYGAPTLEACKRLKFRTVQRDMHWRVQDCFFVWLIKSFTLAVMHYRMETIRILALQMCKRKKPCWTSKRFFLQETHEKTQDFIQSIVNTTTKQEAMAPTPRRSLEGREGYSVRVFFSSLMSLGWKYSITFIEVNVPFKLKSQRMSMWIMMVTKKIFRMMGQGM